MRRPVSILIPAKNEAANLRACLDSARWAGEVVVVDSGSTDGTPDIARAAGAAVVDFRVGRPAAQEEELGARQRPVAPRMGLHPRRRRADHPRARGRDRRVVRSPGADGYYVNRRFWFLDGWLRHCGYYPSWNLRLFRHRLGRYEQWEGVADTGSGDNEIHEHVVLRGRAARLEHEMEHYAFPTIEVWVEKHNRYSNWEARLLASPGGRAAASDAAIAAPLARKRRLKHSPAGCPSGQPSGSCTTMSSAAGSSTATGGLSSAG